MKKIKQNILLSEGNPTGIKGENEGNHKDMNMGQLPLVLKRCIEDWESEIRFTMKDRYFDAFEEISILTNISRSTLRDYITMTEHSVKYPPVDKLIRICLIIKNPKPLQFALDYAASIIGDKVLK